MGFFSRIKEWFMGLFKKDDYLRMTSIQPQIGDGVFESAFFWLPGLLPVVGRPQRALVELFAKRLINQS